MRDVASAVLVVALAVALSGCLDAINPLHGGMGAGSWPLEMVRAVELQDAGRTGKGVKIAVIDTGIDAGHPEFDGLTVEWADLVNDRDKPYDDNGHGTHVIGVLASRGAVKTVASGFYLQGVAPEASFIVIKAIRSDGKGDETTVAQAVRIAVDHGADIVVLSLGGGTFPLLGTDTEKAVGEAVSKGVFVVAAAGNAEKGQTCTVTSPASVADVIAVGAVDEEQNIADFSCRGSGESGGLPVLGGSESDPDRKPEVVAPGVSIRGPWKGGEYVEASGTSQAAPYVGGILALILEGNKDLQRESGNGADSVRKVKEALMTTSTKIGPLGGKGKTAHDSAYGYGLIDAVALDAAV